MSITPTKKPLEAQRTSTTSLVPLYHLHRWQPVGLNVHLRRLDWLDR